MSLNLQHLKKVELHAHLNGCLSNRALVELYELKYGDTKMDKSSDIFYKIIDNNLMSLSDCFKKFKFAHDLTSTRDALELATENVIRDFNEDNVIYLELRTTPRQTESMSKKEYLETVLETIQKCQSKFQIIVKLIPSIDRSQGFTSAKENLDIILKLKENFPNIIVGVDLSGDPNKNNFNMYRDIFVEARENKLKLAFHCGEIKNDDEVLDMINFGIDRIGHGTFIDGESWEILLKKKIPIECCLSSNIKCGTVDTFDTHHFKKLFDSNHPVVICTDDFGVFDTTLTKELEICRETFNLTNDDIIKLNETALKCSFLNENEKQLYLNEIRKSYKI